MNDSAYELPTCPRCGKTTWSVEEHQAEKVLFDLEVKDGEILMDNARTVDSDVTDSFIYCRSCSFGSKQSADTTHEEIVLLQAIADKLEDDL